jgi:rhodanese-related sulfurtransferase
MVTHTKARRAIFSVGRCGLRRFIAFCAALVLALCYAGYCPAYEAEGEVLAVYKNLILIKNTEGGEEAIIAKGGAVPRRRDYIRFEYKESISGVKIAESVTLEKGVALFDPSRELRSAELSALIGDKKDFILIDLRPTSEFNAWHLPTALSMPADETGAERVMEGLKGRKESTVIFYCRNSRDPAANKYAEEAFRAGYKNVMVYSGGADGWVRDGSHVVAPLGHIKESLKDGKPLIFVDTRPSERVKEGHIPGAVNIRPGEMRDEYIMPFEAAERAVFYGEDEGDGSVDFNAMIAANWGYALRSRSPVMVLEGGFKAWEKAGMEVEKGDAPKSITEKPGDSFGMIFYDEFAGLWKEKENGDKVILDVRSKAEAEGVKVGHVINIPIEELPYRLSELPKDKEIIAFCSAGARARIAYNILKKNGFRARYLNRSVRINPDGSLR